MSRYKIVVASYNCLQWLPGTVASIKQQELENYDVCIVDDFSSQDGQAAFIKDACENAGWDYILRTERSGALKNQYDAIHQICTAGDDVVVILDGDDQFAHDRVLNVLDEKYDSHTMLTYGSYQSVPFAPTCPPVVPYPQAVVSRGSYREHTARYGQLFNHLRTFRYENFAKLDPEVDFKIDGKWFEVSTDMAVMIPLLEMSGGRWKYCKEILYSYNSANPISDWRVSARQADEINNYILKTLPRRESVSVWT